MLTVADDALILWLSVTLLPPAKTNSIAEPVTTPVVPTTPARLLPPRVICAPPPPPAPPIMLIVFEFWLRVILLPPAMTSVPDVNVASVPVVFPLPLMILAGPPPPVGIIGGNSFLLGRRTDPRSC